MFKETLRYFDKPKREGIISIFKLVKIYIILLITFVISSCMPKATEKKAFCSANQVFNTLTRSCISSSEVRTRPVGLKVSDSLTQEIAKTITLTYSDANGNSALNCKVSDVNANIEAVSPQVVSRGVFNSAALMYTAANNLAISLPPPSQGLAVAEIVLMKAALDKAKISYSYSNILTQLGLFQASLDNIFALATPISTSSLTIKFYFDSAQTKYLAFAPIKSFVDNRCDCSGGVCTTVIAPRIIQSGNSGFTYTVTDKDGESDPRVVSLTIAPTSKSASSLTPAVASSSISFTQNSTHASLPNNFDLPVARDYFGTTSFNYTFGGTKVVQSGLVYGYTSKGKITHCMDLAFSTGPTDTSCVYTQLNADEYSVTTPVAASGILGDLTFTAKSPGTYGNSFKIKYYNLTDDNLSFDAQATRAESFGLVSPYYPDSYIRVIGNTIEIFLVVNSTSTSDIKDLINSDSKAKTLVAATGGATTTFPDPTNTLVPSEITLANGTDSFDTINYTVNNGFSDSVNSTSVIFSINHTDHAPLVPFEYAIDYSPLVLTPATAVAEAEGTAITQNIILPYFDSDNDPAVKPVSCTVDLITPPNGGLNPIFNTCSCSITGICSVDVLPITYFNGTAKFSYTITTTDRFSAATKTSGSQAVNMTIWEVNDAPILTIGAASTTAGGITTPYTAPLTNPLPLFENSTAAASSTYICFTENAGGGTDESILQTLTATAVQDMTLATTPDSNLIITFGTILAPSAVGNNCTAGFYMLPFTTAKNQSGLTAINLKLSDNGTTHGVAAPITTTVAIPLNIQAVDDPPYFITSASTPAFTSVQTNEGGAVIAGPFQVDEDEGSTLDENNQGIQIANITSDNTAVLPVSAITVFYDLNDNGVADSGEERTFGSSSIVAPTSQTLETAPLTDDVKAHKFYLKLNPVAGVSGNSNITVTIFDGIASVAASHFVSKTFSLIVNPVAALHGGWANITAVGIKTDKNGAPVTLKTDTSGYLTADSEVLCNYNKSSDLKKCDTATKDCVGDVPPNSSITPDAVNVLYWDKTNKRCYRSQGNDKFSWIDIKSSCPITRVTNVATSICGGQNCLYDPTLSPAQSIPTASATGQYYLDTSTRTCYYSTQPTPGVFTWNSPYIPSKVTLAWNSFNITGSGGDIGVSIEGWNVYRREKGYDYDFKNGFLKLVSTDTMTISTSSTTTFTDTTAIAGKVYYYLVRPVDSRHHLPTYTPEVFSEIRVLAPTENFSFVHRWMVNQEICNNMHMTTTSTPASSRVDPTNNYRCPYKGPGATAAGFYDIGKDMLVDISEAGCPYSLAPKCTANGCVGVGAPSSTGTSLAINDIYYDRSSGSCFYVSAMPAGVATWTNFNTSTAGALTSVNTALNPPLVNVSQNRSKLICQARTPGSATTALTGTVAPDANLSLPTKKEYIAYAAAPYKMSDSTITDLEQGFSLNIQSRCNSSSANGIDGAFSDSPIPSTSYQYSIPGTATSGIRSIYTGSIPWGSNTSTESCRSRYGVQDVYGNVAEWVQESMTCDSSTNICSTNAGTELGDYDFDTVNSTFKHYGFDLLTGPYNDSNADSTTGATDSFLTQWIFRDELYGAGKFNFPMGMPMFVDIGTGTSAVAGSNAIPYLLDIGPTSGITNSQLHEDGIIVNGALTTLINGVVAASIETLINTTKTDAATLHSNTSASLARAVAVLYDSSYAAGTPENNAYLAALTADNSALAAYNAVVTASVSATLSKNAITNFPFETSTSDLVAQTKNLVTTAQALVLTARTDATTARTQALLAPDGTLQGLTLTAQTSGTTALTDANSALASANTTVSGTGGIAVGGGYQSGNLSGRYSSELIPTADVRDDVGFRCYLPIYKDNFPADTGRHTYSY